MKQMPKIETPDDPYSKLKAWVDRLDGQEKRKAILGFVSAILLMWAFRFQVLGNYHDNPAWVNRWTGQVYVVMGNTVRQIDDYVEPKPTAYTYTPTYTPPTNNSQRKSGSSYWDNGSGR